MNFFSGLQNLDRRILYVILIVLCSVGLFMNVPIEVSVDQSTVDLYQRVMEVPADKTVIIQTDWTTSTRGENMAHLEALARILMSRHIRFVFYTATSDAPAVEVSRMVVQRIIAERKKEGLWAPKWNDDVVSLGLFPNTEGINEAMGQDLHKAWGDRHVIRDGQSVSPFDTAALKDVKSIKDVPLMIVITASSTNDVAVERLSDKVTLGLMCTGVVGPTSMQYYPAQFKGIASGLKAGYEFEYMMKYGVNHSIDGAEPKVKNEKANKDIPPVPDGKNLERANKYYWTLHLALAFVILVVLIGNIGMFMSKRSTKEAQA